MSRALEVLIVEDDPTMTRLIEAVFRGASLGEFLVHRAPSLADAVTAAREVTPDLILLDLDLPDAKGLEGVRSLLALAPSAAMVILTASTDEAQAVDAIRLGAQDWIQKRAGLEMLLPRAVTFAVERQRRRVSLIGQIERMKELPEG